MSKNVQRILSVLLVLVFALFGWITWSYFSASVQRPPRDFGAPASRFDFGKTLVVYYSLGGNTAEVAGRIRDITSGTLFEIETEKVYPSIPALYIVAGLELKNGNLPVLKNTVVDFSPYDVIFVGAPVWFYTVSAPMLSFLSDTDFMGKTVVPFATDGGKYGDYFTDFAKKARNANILDGMSFTKVSNTDTSILDQKILSWLYELGLNK